MKERFAKLLSVKSIVTIFLTIIFGYMCITDQITADQIGKPFYFERKKV